MALAEEKKRWMLGGALLLTLGASAWLGLGADRDEQGADVVEVVQPAPARQDAAPRRAEHPLPLPVLAELRSGGDNEQRAGEQRAADVFKSHSWYVPPPPPPRPVQIAVAPPAPPPLPFTFLGTVQDDGQTVVFLAKGQRLYTVRKGEVFDGQYRLEDAGKGRIELVYLPLNAKQTLVI